MDDVHDAAQIMTGIFENKISIIKNTEKLKLFFAKKNVDVHSRKAMFELFWESYKPIAMQLYMEHLKKTNILLPDEVHRELRKLHDDIIQTLCEDENNEEIQFASNEKHENLALSDIAEEKVKKLAVGDLTSIELETQHAIVEFLPSTLATDIQENISSSSSSCSSSRYKRRFKFVTSQEFWLKKEEEEEKKKKMMMMKKRKVFEMDEVDKKEEEEKEEEEEEDKKKKKIKVLEQPEVDDEEKQPEVDDKEEMRLLQKEHYVFFYRDFVFQTGPIQMWLEEIWDENDEVSCDMNGHLIDGLVVEDLPLYCDSTKSNAEVAGMREGDYIVGVNNISFSSVSFQNTMDGHVDHSCGKYRSYRTNFYSNALSNASWPKTIHVLRRHQIR